MRLCTVFSCVTSVLTLIFAALSLGLLVCGKSQDPRMRKAFLSAMTVFAVLAGAGFSKSHYFIYSKKKKEEEEEICIFLNMFKVRKTDYLNVV